MPRSLCNWNVTKASQQHASVSLKLPHVDPLPHREHDLAAERHGPGKVVFDFAERSEALLEIFGGDPALEHLVTKLNRGGFPRIILSDSRCGLVKEASPDGEISVN